MKDNLDNIFKNLENHFDLEEPDIGHFNRFETKLNKSTKNTRHKIFKVIASISVAASILLLIGVWLGSNYNNKGMELAGISTEMQETQNYFINTIHKELETIEKERSTDTNKIINDGLHQLTKLEKQYTALTLELKESTEDKRIIYAMISNFQRRIEVLQSLLEQIENVKQLKSNKNEEYV